MSKTVIDGQTHLYAHDCQNSRDHIEFIDDNSGREVYHQDCEPFNDYFSYLQEGNNLYLAYNQIDTEEFVIQELSSSKLRLKSRFDVDEDGDLEDVIYFLTKN